MLAADHSILFVTKVPTNLCVRRGEEMSSFVPAKQEKGGAG